MPLLKRTDTWPPDIVEQFEQIVAAGQRSPLVAQLLHEWLDQQRREQRCRDVIEGCREMADVYVEPEQVYHPLEEEVDRALDAHPQTRRHRVRAARPGGRV